MSLRLKLFLSFLIILFLIISLLSVNSFMAKSKNSHMKRLLWIHHQYTSLLNLKIVVNLQRSEAQEIFIYDKAADLQNFQKTTEMVKKEVKDLVAAETMEGALNPGTDDPSQEVARERQRLIEIQHGYEDLYRELMLLIKLVQVGRKAKVTEHFNKEIGGRFNQFFNQIDTWIEFEEKKLAEVETGYIQLSYRHNLATVLGLSLILLMVLIYFVLFVYLLGPRLKGLFIGTRRIADGDFTEPIAEKGNDEFTNLARAMNQMMSRLAESRKKLLEQSYYSGMADMVSGVLHNVKNALAPVLIDMENMESRAKQIRSGKVLEAARNLANEALSEERRQDLIEYVELACGSIDDHAREFHETLVMMKTKVDLIDRVLSEHNKFSGAERPLELIKVEELIQDSLALVRKDYLEKINVAVEANIAATGEIKTQRIVVIQVLANLIMNALESIIRSENSNGRVSISAKRSDTNGTEKVHLKVRDNGEGISPERLALIFQRGVSSKQGSFGLGLHWCANSVASLNGQLYAESEGVGHGTCMNLIL